MFCTFCGEKNKIDAEYCKSCGKKQIKELIFAGFMIRLGAYCIDMLGLLILAFCAGIIIGIFDPNSEIFDSVLLSYILWIFYSSIFLYFWSTTPGKKIYGLKVQTEEGRSLTFKTSIIRSLLQPLSTLLFGIGYWNMDKNDKKQAWHDNKARTLVIKEKEKNYIIPIILSIAGAVIYFILTVITES